MIPPAYRSMSRRTSKPRASGDDPGAPLFVLSRAPVNPARAGMIPSSELWAAFPTGKPRASGDDPSIKNVFKGGVE